MESKIQQNGCLAIKRAGKWKNQYCPGEMNDTDGRMPCSDECPHFGEPDTYKDEDCKMDMLKICNGRYLLGTVIDERKAEAGE